MTEKRKIEIKRMLENIRAESDCKIAKPKKSPAGLKKFYSLMEDNKKIMDNLGDMECNQHTQKAILNIINQNNTKEAIKLLSMKKTSKQLNSEARELEQISLNNSYNIAIKELQLFNVSQAIIDTIEQIKTIHIDIFTKEIRYHSSIEFIKGCSRKYSQKYAMFCFPAFINGLVNGYRQYDKCMNIKDSILKINNQITILKQHNSNNENKDNIISLGNLLILSDISKPNKKLLPYKVLLESLNIEVENIIPYINITASSDIHRSTIKKNINLIKILPLEDIDLDLMF
jgi:hypothetical protein